MCCGNTTAWSLTPQIQPFLAVDPARLLVIDKPAFASQQDMNALRAITYSRLGDLPDTSSLSTVIARVRLIKYVA